MMKQGKLTARVLNVFMAAVLALGMTSISLPQEASAEAGNRSNVETWGELATAAKTAGDIVVTKDLVVDNANPIVVDKDITITGSGITIYQDGNATEYQTMFTVANGGALTIGEGLTLSGQSIACTQGETATLDQFEKTEDTHADKLTLEGTKVVEQGDQISLPDPVETAATWVAQPTNVDFSTLVGETVMIGVEDINLGGDEVIPGVVFLNTASNRLLLVRATEVLNDDGTLRDGVTEARYALYAEELSSSYDGLALKTSDGYYIGRPSDKTGAPIGFTTDKQFIENKISNVNPNGAFMFQMKGVADSGKKYFSAHRECTPNANNYLALYNQSDVADGALYLYVKQGGSSVWVVDGVEYTDVDSAQAAVDRHNENATVTYWMVDGTRCDDEASAQQAIDAYNNAKTTYWEIDGTRYDDQAKAEAALVAYNEAHGTQCPDEGTCGTITSGKFTGTAAAPKGFFVQVEEGGAATLDGATLTNFITDGSVVHAAPVVANGGRFDVKSGSISGNSVGYTANNSEAQWNALALGFETEDGTYSYSGYLGRLAKTETAGGVIYTAGARGDITGGSISNNRGDTGGVIVQGAAQDDAATVEYGGTPSKVYLKSDGSISNNLGLHHAGGLLVFNGGAVQMEDEATISQNFSWHKGGGVFVSEEALGSMNNNAPYRKVVGDATFIMKGGSISGNVAIHRGGGIEVASNHVSLYGGSIDDNNSRVLGGGIYVEGHHGRMYQLYIANACITGNRAISIAEEASIPTWWSNNSPNTCGFDNSFNTGLTGTGRDLTYRHGFWSDEGRGGAIWQCQMGGNTTFSIGDRNNVVIYGNDAYADGDDVLLTSPGGKVGNSINVIKQGMNQFQIEGTSEVLADGGSYSGPLALKNVADIQGCSGGVSITGNTSLNGGAIAANGTVIFGDAVNTYRTAANIDVSKMWGVERGTEPVNVRLFAEIDGKRVSFGDGKDPLAETTVKLNGVADQLVGSDAETGSDAQLGEDQYAETSVAYESSPWVASIGLPLTLVVDGKTVPLFKVVLDGEELNPTSQGDLQTIYNAGSNVSATLADWILVVAETDAEGNTLEYKMPMGGTTLTSIENVPEEGQPVVYRDIDGNRIIEAGTYTTHFNLAQTIANDSGPQIEKYVSKDVHKEVEWGEEFPYDIMVYVPMDADSIRIKDTLDSQLVFASTKADIEASVVVKDANDHTVHGTVENGAASEASVKGVATLDGQNLVVEVADAKAARGKFIQVSFTAKLKDGVKLSYTTIDENGDVLGGADVHEGVPNTASYDIKVGNNWDSDHESNTVTVKPKPDRPEIEKYVNKNVHKDITLDEVFTYDVVAYVTKDANNLVITDTLDDVLAFATDASAIKVVSLADADADHTLATGKWIAAGTAVDNAVANIDGRVLTVTIADASAIRGQWVKVTFDAKVALGKTLADLEAAYADINHDAAEDRAESNVGNAPVISDEDHSGVPNTASYVIGVGNSPNAYSDTSNTVTVKPRVVKISKTDLGGTELEGAVITVSGPEGFTETWTSELSPHVLVLKPGTYTMVETVAPDGYECVTTTIEFSVAEDGTVEVLSTDVVGGEVEVDENGVLVLKDAPIKDEPQIEKYINKDVHQSLSSTDETFTYDILAYATKDATKLTIFDNLVQNLEYVSTEADVVVVDLGARNNHLTDSTFTGKNENATVSAEGQPVDFAASIVDGKSLTVVVDNIADQGLRGHWVRVTVEAKIVVNDGYVDIYENGSVLSDLAHDGIDNTASYVVDTARGPYDEIESNTVTVKTEKPEIEKYVNKNVHSDIMLKDTFSYDIVAYVTTDADKITVLDELNGQLQFASAESDVKVALLGADVDHTPYGSVAQGGEDVTESALVTISGQTLRVFIENAAPYRGQWVKVSFDAKIKDGLSVDDLELVEVMHDATDAQRAEANVGNDPVITDEDHVGVPNSASYAISVDNKPSAYSDSSNTVTVKPEQPEIEKYVNQDVHQHIAMDESFTYDIMAYVTTDADVVTITDTLNPALAFASKTVAVADMGEKDNHKTNGSFTGANADASVAQAGEAIDAQVEISGQNLTVTIADASAYRGHWVKVTFQAKLAAGKTYEDAVAAYAAISASQVEDRDVPNVGNAPVLSSLDHTGIPNTASYTIGLNKVVVDENGNPVYDENGNPVVETVVPEGYGDTSNTVTVSVEQPGVEKFPVLISKTDLGGTEIEGATITVTGPDGFVETWTSTTKPHELQLVPGEYTMTEVVAPEGFQRVTTAINFTVDADGTVRLGTTTVDAGGAIEVMDANHVVLKDAPVPSDEIEPTPTPTVDKSTYEVTISKQEVGGGPELPGATLVVKDVNGKVVEQWVSGNEPHKIALEPGIYTLTEITAPKGYEVAETMTFRVNANGTVECLQDGKWVDATEHVVMFDAPTPEEEIDLTPTPKVNTPKYTPTPTRPTTPTTVVRGMAKTMDEFGPVVVGLALLAVAALIFAAVSIRRRRSE